MLGNRKTSFMLGRCFRSATVAEGSDIEAAIHPCGCLVIISHHPYFLEIAADVPGLFNAVT